MRDAATSDVCAPFWCTLLGCCDTRTRARMSAPTPYVHSLILPEQTASVVQCQRTGGVVRVVHRRQGEKAS